jgi:hypothetical protein
MSQVSVTWTTTGNITFVNTYDTTNVDSSYITSIELAESAIGALWTSTSPITLTLDFVSDVSGKTEIASNTAYSYVAVTYSDLAGKLPSWDTLPPDPRSGGFFYLPEAYARMLGLSTFTPPPSSFDATITLNTNYPGLDEVSAIEHEITEGAMGRIGGLGEKTYSTLSGTLQSSIWGAPDLFRYSNGVYDKQPNDTTYFSSNGGSTISSLAYFTVNSGNDTADLNANDVFGFNGAYTFSQTDKEMMNALGWEPILPELEITTNSLRPLNANVQTGDTISLSATVKNYGATSAGTFGTQFYISHSATFDSTAIAIGTPVVTTSLAAGATITLNVTATVPSITVGTDYLFAVPDYLHQVTQLTNNNVSYSTAIKVMPAIVINTLADFAGIRNNLSGHYILGANIDATGLTIAPIGSSTSPFIGTFDGNGHTINGLHIVGNGIYVGLFAEVGAGGKISNLGLTNVSVSAPRGYDVGGLVGRNLGTIENSYTSGSISGIAGNFVFGLNGIAIGGVAGWNFGMIKNSYSSAAITSDSTISVDLGGLAGGNSGMIDHSHASGTIKGHSGAYGSGLVEIGGLVGSLGFGATGGKIQNSYATGSVISDGSNTAAGGLVGASVSSSTIFQSYATGSVSTGGPSWDGGLVGILFNGTISQSFAKGFVTVGNLGNAGGLVGAMNAGTIFESYAKGAATGASSTDVGGLVAHSYGGTISQSYATGKVITTGPFAIAGGLAAESSAFTTSSYWDYQSTGQLKSSGGIAEPTFFLTLGTLPVGFDPTVWAENVFWNGRYPFLKWQPPAKAIDGYLSGATVFADDNNNGILDPGELFTVTDGEGTFDPIGGTGPLIVYGGTDTSTGLLFKGFLAAPAGSTVITPLTTLISGLQSQGDSVAEQKVLAAFGLSSGLDLTTFDPIAAMQAGDIPGAEVAVAVAKVYNTISLIASALVGAGGTFVKGANGAFAAIAAAIGGPGINLADNAALSALISSVALSESVSLGQGVADKVAFLIAASNATLDEKAQADSSGDALLNDIAAIERVFQGSVSNAIQQSADDPAQLQVILDAFSGAKLTSAITTALSHLGNNQDLDPPTLTPVADQTVEATSAAGAVASFSATATDLLDGSDPVVFKEGSTVVHSGDILSLGSHAITAYAIDAAGNSASETFTIKVTDTTAPTLTPVADRTVHATSLAGTIVTFSATASDLVDDNDPVVFKENNTVVHSGDVFALGVHTISASTSDVAGNSASESFTINVVDAAPSVSPLERNVGEDGPLLIQDMLAGASDPDAGDSLSIAGLDASVTTAGGRLLVLGTDYTLSGSSFALTPAGFATFNGLAASQTDHAVFHYGVSDGIFATVNALTLNISGANDAPTLVHQTASQSATAGAPFSLALPANTFQDADSGDHLTLAATLGNGTALPSWLTFNAATGIFSGRPGPGNAGDFDIKVTATDTGGLAAADIFHVTVINHPPVITSDAGGDAASIIITDDSKYVATVHATDPDPNTALKYSIAGGADQKLFTIDSSTGLLSFKSMPQEGHSYQVTVAASDGGLQDTQAVKVQVAKGVSETGNPNVADNFVFKPGFELAIVSNFDAASANHDVLELDHALFRHADVHSSPAAIFALIENHSFQFGRDVVIVTDTHDVIDLKNTSLHSLTAQDFLMI